MAYNKNGVAHLPRESRISYLSEYMPQPTCFRLLISDIVFIDSKGFSSLDRGNFSTAVVL